MNSPEPIDLGLTAEPKVVKAASEARRFRLYRRYRNQYLHPDGDRTTPRRRGEVDRSR